VKIYSHGSLLFLLSFVSPRSYAFGQFMPSRLTVRCADISRSCTHI